MENKNEEHLSKICEWLYLGDVEGAMDREALEKLDIGFVLNTTKDLDNFFEEKLEYKRIAVEDWEYEDVKQHFSEAFVFLDKAANTYFGEEGRGEEKEGRKKGEKCLVHCAGGSSRSPTFVIAYLMKREGWCLKDTLQFTKEKREVVEPNEGFAAQLVEFEKELRGENSMQVDDFEFSPED